MAATTDEVAGWANVVAALSWSGVDGDPQDASTDVGAVLSFLGDTPTSHWRLLAFLAEDHIREAMRNWKGKQGDAEWQPSLALQAQILAACSARLPSQ
eukprot:604636-Amphidinium_carterae.1